MNLWIYEIPEGRDEEVYKILGDYGVLWEGPGSIAGMKHNIETRGDFFNEECSLGTAEEIHDELVKLGVTHQAHQDPRYEWDGVLVRYHPQLGKHYTNANAEALATLTDVDYRRLEVEAREVEARIGEPFEIVLLSMIGEHLGIAYEDDFRQLTGQPDLNAIFAKQHKMLSEAGQG